MADLLKGYTFSPTEQVTAAKLHALIDSGLIQTGAITDRTVSSSASSSDYMLIYNASAGALRKIAASDIVAGGSFSGAPIKSTVAEYSTQSSVTAVIPLDSTIPQNTEGTQILSASITPASASDKVLVLVNFCGATNASIKHVVAVFRDAGVNAIFSTIGMYGPNGYGATLMFLDSPASAAALTYNVRVGPGQAATIRINLNDSSETLGGTMKCTLALFNIKA